MTDKLSLQNVIRELSDAELKPLVRDTLDWQRTGLLSGETMKAFVADMLPKYPEYKYDIHRLVDAFLTSEAALRYANS